MNLKNYLSQIPGYHTNRKILAIESDDWGSIRTSSKQAFLELSKKLPHIGNDSYTKFDSLETEEDIQALFEVLDSVRDCNNNPAVITANTIVANPDFELIHENDFRSYFYESIDKTFFKRDGNERVLDLYKKGINKGIYIPQLHGREHVNFNQWMKALQSGHKELLLAFNHRMFGITLSEPFNFKKNLMGAWDYSDIREVNEHELIIQEAQHIFEKLFGNKSSTIIAPSYIWHPLHESFFLKNGINATQGLPYQYIPNPGGNWYKKKFRFTSKRSKITSLVRNAFFEPSLDLNKGKVVEECLRRINIAFKMGKPAIIGSHRINFMGGMDPSNRETNLILFNELLNRIVERWKDVEFMSSNQLVSIIKGESNA